MNGAGYTDEMREGRRGGGGGAAFGASLDYFAMVQSTPSDLYFRQRPGESVPIRVGINSTGQVLQFPRKRDNASRAMLRYNGVRLSCHQSGQFTDGLEGSHCVEAPSRPSTVCAYAGTLPLSLSLFLSISPSLSLSLSHHRCRYLHSAADGLLKVIYYVNRNGFKRLSSTIQYLSYNQL